MDDDGMWFAIRIGLLVGGFCLAPIGVAYVAGEIRCYLRRRRAKINRARLDGQGGYRR